MHIHPLITDSATLANLCTRLAQADFITVDTEFMRESTYWPELCLIQVADTQEAAAIDPLAPGLDLTPLLDLLVDTADAAGTAVLVVTHDDAVAARMQRMVHLRDGRVGEEATAEGRWSVLGTDGSLQLPQGLRADWPDGALVSVDEVAPGELRVRRVTDDEGGVLG